MTGPLALDVEFWQDRAVTLTETADGWQQLADDGWATVRDMAVSDPDYSVLIADCGFFEGLAAARREAGKYAAAVAADLLAQTPVGVNAGSA